jgi:hypothetical protein
MSIWQTKSWGKILYVFVDESWNMDFSEKGTKYFVLAAVTTLNPIESSVALQTLKYSLLNEWNGGEDFQHFHATEDRQIIRDRVFETFCEMENITINYLWAQKCKTPLEYRKRDTFYALLGWKLSQYILKKYNENSFDKVIIIFDKALNKKEQGEFFKTVKPELKKIWKPYAIYFHQTLSDFNGQIADYCAWAKYVSLERDEKRPLEAIKNIPKNDFDIFEKYT